MRKHPILPDPKALGPEGEMAFRRLWYEALVIALKLERALAEEE